MQSRPDRVIFFKALGGRKRQRKEVTEAKRKAGVQEEEERGGKVGAVRVSALRKGAAHAPWDKPMRRKLGRGDVGEGGRLPTGGLAPEASRKMDPELRLPPPLLRASQIQWSSTPPSDPWRDFLPRSLS